MLTCLSWLSVYKAMGDSGLSRAVFKLWKTGFFFTQTYRLILFVTLLGRVLYGFLGIFWFY